MSEEVNRNTMIQLSNMYTDRECHSRLRHRWTDQHYHASDATSRSYCVQQYDRLIDTLLEVLESSVTLEINFCINRVQIAVGKLTLSPSKPLS